MASVVASGQSRYPSRAVPGACRVRADQHPQRRPQWGSRLSLSATTSARLPGQLPWMLSEPLWRGEPA